MSNNLEKNNIKMDLRIPIPEVYDPKNLPPIVKWEIKNRMNLDRWKYEIEYGKIEKKITIPYTLIVSLSLNVFFLFYILFNL